MSKGSGTRKPSTSVGVVVEGDTEFYALPLLHSEKIIPGCPLLKMRNVGGIGSEVAATGIAYRVHKPVLGLLVAGARRVIVCFDRERRNVCPGQLAQAVWRELDALLKKKGYSAQEVSIVVADRSFEAWLLADAEGLAERGLFKKKPKFGLFEGSPGRRDKLGAVEITDLLGREYDKASDGPRLFRELNFSVARQWGPSKRGSRSLDKLLRTLGI